MADAKTKLTEQSVAAFLETFDETIGDACKTIAGLMEEVTGEQAKMWGPAIIGFGQYHYKYGSGHEGDICLLGFSPRAGKFALYVLAGFPGQEEVLGRLGKYKAKGGCLYIKKLNDVNFDVLKELLLKAYLFKKKLHNT